MYKSNEASVLLVEEFATSQKNNMLRTLESSVYTFYYLILKWKDLYSLYSEKKRWIKSPRPKEP